MSTRREQRIRRTRARLTGTSQRPRAAVWRGLRAMSVQIIDDSAHQTLVAVSSRQVPDSKGPKREVATRIGELVAERALEQGIDKIVFDRGGYKYHGRVKAVAEAMRQGGLKF